LKALYEASTNQPIQWQVRVNKNSNVTTKPILTLRHQNQNDVDRQRQRQSTTMFSPTGLGFGDALTIDLQILNHINESTEIDPYRRVHSAAVEG
jgi:hypothetical protein